VLGQGGLPALIPGQPDPGEPLRDNESRQEDGFTNQNNLQGAVETKTRYAYKLELIARLKPY